MPNLACEHEETATSARLPVSAKTLAVTRLAPSVRYVRSSERLHQAAGISRMSSGAWGRFWRQLLQAWCWCTCDVMRRGFPPCGQKRWKHSGQPWPPPNVRLNVYSNQNAYTPVMFGEQIQHVHFVLMPRGSEVPVEH